jgi:hypothetical protein
MSRVRRTAGGYDPLITWSENKLPYELDPERATSYATNDSDYDVKVAVGYRKTEMKKTSDPVPYLVVQQGGRQQGMRLDVVKAAISTGLITPDELSALLGRG